MYIAHRPRKALHSDASAKMFVLDGSSESATHEQSSDNIFFPIVNSFSMYLVLTYSDLSCKMVHKVVYES